jgi:uncharacterized membrane protein
VAEGFEGGRKMKKIYGWVIALILLSFVMTGAFLTLAPNVVPVHFGVDGNADRWGSKYEFLLMPGISTFAAVTMLLTGRVNNKTEKQSPKVVGISCIWTLVLCNVLFGYFMYKALQGGGEAGKITELPMKLICVVILASFIPLGNLMPKVKRGSMIGLRTKWSMANDICWQKSQRFGGFWAVGTGILGAIACAVAPAGWSPFILTGLLVVLAIAGLVGSYVIYRKEI